MKIGIDLDDVVCEFTRPYLEFHNEKFKTSFEFDEVTSHNLWEVLGLSFEETKLSIKEFQDNHLSVEDFPLFSNVKEFIERLSENHTLHFITARPKEIINETKSFLDKNFSNWDFNLTFSNGMHDNASLSKADICVKEGIGVMVEDNFNFARECAEKGIRVLLFDQPWNRDYKCFENIIRVGGWREVFDRINEIREEDAD
tara:strand:+ start:698 stop:1297 length:600 start_codon:yes stop_codon:yes gene_type:complete